MPSQPTDNAYNTRLFSGGLRRWVHMARFAFLAGALRRYRHSPRRVLELGCYDAKSIEHLPQLPDYYLGLDANWDGGLDIGRLRWGDTPQIELACCTAPPDVPAGMEPFDTVICMETIEHLPPADVNQYLDRLAALAGGLVLVTVPNEIGAVFAGKWLFKAALGRNTYHYSAREWLAATLGQTAKVQRQEHKGFDYRRLIDALADRFEILEVSPLPVSWLPVRFGVTIGIVARSRHVADVSNPQSAPRSVSISKRRPAA